ncbi:MAG: glycoside hydrolase family 25 protein [Anaerolineales bacterium]|nr:glycoside hydrolase family 25 protein [Anaerolineales bacterium]
MTDYRLGMDVSHWQGNMNFVTAAQRGIEWCYMKATQGITIIDASLKENRKKAKAVNMRFGFYHYYMPGVDPIQQALYFADAINDDPGDLPPIVDLEETKSIPGGYAAKVRTFLSTLINCSIPFPGIYTAPAYWMQHFGPSCSWACEFPLWIANYSYYSNRSLSAPTIPLPWQPLRWLAWQYTAKADGLYYGAESKQIDLDIMDWSRFPN